MPQNIGTVPQSASILFACYGQTLIKFILNQNSDSIESIMTYTPGRNETFLSIAVDTKCSKPCTVRITLHAIR